MKRELIAALFFLVSLTLVSCSKFSNGEPVTEQRTVGHFETLCMFSNVNVNLKHSSQPHLELTCPKNLIDNIVTEAVGDSLVIRNDNNFDWLRSYDYTIDLNIYYDSLREINFASTARLTSLDTLRGMIMLDSLETTVHGFILRITEGCGDIDLCFSCDVLKTVFSFGTSKVTLRGKAAYAEHYLKSYGAIHAENLKSYIVKVQSQSTNDIYVWARNVLEAYLSSIGNVYYKGNPWIVQECTNEGQVIKLE